MIVREHSNTFIVIEQDNHAHISAEIINNFREDFLNGKAFRKSVMYAIYMHDFGWKAFDTQPFWNDEKQAPYTFIDFPTPAKVVLYQHGIDVVEQQDAYAALLCSEHYTRFLLHDNANESQAFVKQEKERQQRIIAAFPDFDQQAFDFHYGLLQLCDNLSLYLCLNEPNVAKGNVHPFFRDGISLSPALHVFSQSKMQLSWLNEETIKMNESPLLNDLTIKLKQKSVRKEGIFDEGLIKAYQSAPLQTVPIHLLANK